MALQVFESNGKVVIRPAQQETRANGGALDASLVAGEDLVAHVVGRLSRVPKCLRWKLPHRVHSPWAVRTGLLAMNR